MTKQPLTAKEYMVLEFVKQYVERKGYAPTYQEIKDKFDFASFFSVQRYLKQLETKGYVKTPWGNKKRALQIMNPDTEIPTHQIPFLGRVAAGRPIEAIESRELIEIPADMIRKKEHTPQATRNQRLCEDAVGK
jgi:repressor LexA